MGTCCVILMSLVVFLCLVFSLNLLLVNSSLIRVEGEDASECHFSWMRRADQPISLASKPKIGKIMLTDVRSNDYVGLVCSHHVEINAFPSNEDECPSLQSYTDFDGNALVQKGTSRHLIFTITSARRKFSFFSSDHPTRPKSILDPLPSISKPCCSSPCTYIGLLIFLKLFQLTVAVCVLLTMCLIVFNFWSKGKIAYVRRLTGEKFYHLSLLSPCAIQTE
eukprot:GDKJ01009744.1.p1 GENE.GDKJ01009744.1~~GDKJ01009744.1.p1  ORF type:complete len:222 (-),score=45.70 GDKJ01009744.1:47-712(-)